MTSRVVSYGHVGASEDYYHIDYRRTNDGAELSAVIAAWKHFCYSTDLALRSPFG